MPFWKPSFLCVPQSQRRKSYPFDATRRRDPSPTPSAPTIGHAPVAQAPIPKYFAWRKPLRKYWKRKHPNVVANATWSSDFNNTSLEALLPHSLSENSAQPSPVICMADVSLPVPPTTSPLLPTNVLPFPEASTTPLSSPPPTPVFSTAIVPLTRVLVELPQADFPESREERKIKIEDLLAQTHIGEIENEEFANLMRGCTIEEITDMLRSRPYGYFGPNGQYINFFELLVNYLPKMAGDRAALQRVWATEICHAVFARWEDISNDTDSRRYFLEHYLNQLGSTNFGKHPPNSEFPFLLCGAPRDFCLRLCAINDKGSDRWKNVSTLKKMALCEIAWVTG